MSSLKGSLVAETLEFDGGRKVTVYVPPASPEVVVYAVDGGWHTERLAAALEASAQVPSTMIVGVHGLDDDDERLNEYVESFGGERFAAFARFFVDDVSAWVASEFDMVDSAAHTVTWGASLGGEFALAMGLRHPAIYGAIFCASPGGGFTPANASLASPIPPTYLFAGTQEPWFLDNARRWSDALGKAGAEVAIEERDGDHGDAFWYDELPHMLTWLGDTAR